MASPLRGRPRLADDQRRTERLMVRATPADVDTWYKLSHRTRLPLSTLVRYGLKLVARRPPHPDFDE